MFLSLNKTVALLTFAVGIVLLPTRSLACSCGATDTPFIQVARNKDIEFTELIVRGVVHPHPQGKNSVELEILEVIKGNEERKKNRVWGDNGALCRPYISSFPVGTEWVMALDTVSPFKGRGFPADNVTELPLRRSPEETDYAISGCGTYALQVVDNSVKGIISKRRFNPVTKKVWIQKFSLEAVTHDNFHLGLINKRGFARSTGLTPQARSALAPKGL